MRKTLLFLTALLFSIKSFGQIDSISQYLNDNKRSNFSKILKLDLTGTMYGNFLVSMEKRVNDNFRIEAGAGILTSAFYNPIFGRIYTSSTDEFDNSRKPVKMNKGFSLLFSPRVTDTQNPELYACFNAVTQLYFKQLVTTDLSLAFGKMYLLSSRFVLDVSLGFGLDAHWSLDDNLYVQKGGIMPHKIGKAHAFLRPYIPLNLKLGYRLL